MKRYLVSFLLGLLIICGLVTYFVVGAVDHLPEYKLSTIQGDSEVGKAIVLSGSYGGRNQSKFLSVTTEGSNYYSRSDSIGNDLRNYRTRSVEYESIQKLIDEHPRFMRKKGSVDGFYMNEESVIYADADKIKHDKEKPVATLRVDLLNRSTNVEKQFTTLVQVKNDYHTINVVDVQQIGNEIYILVSSYPYSRGFEEYSVHVLDSTSGKLLRSEQLQLPEWRSKEQNEEAHISSMRMIMNTKISAPSDYFIMNIQQDSSNEDMWYSYSYKTGEFTKLPTSDSMKDRVNYNLTGDQFIVYGQFDYDKVIVSRYNLSTGLHEANDLTITAEDLGVEKIRNVIVDEDRLYLLLHNNGAISVTVLDVVHGQPLYSGQATYEGPTSTAKDELEQLRLLNINIKG